MIEEKKKNIFWFEKPIVCCNYFFLTLNVGIIYFDKKKKNDQFENTIRNEKNEMSQNFCTTCGSGGKDPPSYKYT